VCGVCDGDGTSCQSGCESLEGYWGCDDICNGLVEDECEVCGGDGPEENYDCDGNCINIDCAGECAKNIFLWGVCYNISETYGLYLSSSITLNQLSGGIPSEIGNLYNLNYIYLEDNNLTGGIPPEIGNLPNLINLWLGGNQLTGQIPSEIGGLTTLTSLNLGDNQLTGEIPPEIGQLEQLDQLVLNANQLSGEIPSEIGHLTNLTLLILRENQLTGEIPQTVCDLIESIDLGINYYILDGNNLTNTCE
jgi:hypothetical protein